MRVEKFFSFMNDIDFPYVVMRNYDGLPEVISPYGHNDLDLLVYDFDHWQEIFPQARREHNAPRVQFSLEINGGKVFIDVRSVGDGYYPTMFQINMLATRKFNGTFFTPDKEHHLLGLVYHVAHHKGRNTYPNVLGDAKVEDLFESLKKSGMGYADCKDTTVGRFNAYYRGATSIVEKKDGGYVKKQEGYMEYDLIGNEYRLLGESESNHFPEVWKENDSIVIEDCGERLTTDNLPDDWKFQLIQILTDLKTYSIIHRDIKPDNLMIKNDTIMLIDFGWAKKEGEEDNPPECLGMPYRPSWGWDDTFSMKKVIKEIEYKLGDL